MLLMLKRCANMPRKNLYFDDDTQLFINELAFHYHDNESEVVRAAVRLLHRSHFHPESTAPDAVLERAARQMRLALAALEGEIERRAELADRRDDED